MARYRSDQNTICLMPLITVQILTGAKWRGGAQVKVCVCDSRRLDRSVKSDLFFLIKIYNAEMVSVCNGCSTQDVMAIH